MIRLHPAFKINDVPFSNAEELLNFLETISSKDRIHIHSFVREWLGENSFISVKTSGSTGIPKEIHLPKQHVLNSALATISFFDLIPNTKAQLCMSAEYIAGKMMLVRAMVGGWNLHISEPERNPLKGNDHFDFTAMVPFQVFHALEDLYKTDKIIIGGGVLSPNLERELQSVDTQAYATYGMTETISHIAIRNINGTGKSEFYKALPGVHFSQKENGCLIIEAREIADEIVETNDVVELISDSEFKFLGRADHVINSGGIKLHPEEIERKLSEFLEVPFFIAGQADEALGERVILVLEGKDESASDNLKKAFKNLRPYEIPKKIFYVPEFLYTDTEKIRRSAILERLNL